MEVEELLLEAFQAAGADDGLIYVSVPITSGPRELRLMAELECTREELRSRHRERWLAEVIRPNEQEAVAYAARVRALFPQQLVVEPARLHVSQWSQADYTSFWETLIRKFALRLVATPDWAFSTGCRLEVEVALEIDLPIFDIRGHQQSGEELAMADEDAKRMAAQLVNPGFESDQYFPAVSLVQSGKASTRMSNDTARREALVNRAFSEVFSWLRGERALQLREFGPERDDNHTLEEGLREDGWWLTQLARYFDRARALGAPTLPGRQALAKYAATAIALVESTIRLYGWLPSPGVRMGQHPES